MSDETPTLPPRIVDSRKHPRERVFLSGRILYGDGSYTDNCRIKDISEGGARIVLTAGQISPTHNVLMEVAGRVVHDTVVARIKPPDFGLAFVNTYPLDGELPKDLDYLKTVWRRHCVPLGGTPL